LERPGLPMTSKRLCARAAIQGLQRYLLETFRASNLAVLRVDEGNVRLAFQLGFPRAAADPSCPAGNTSVRKIGVKKSRLARRQSEIVAGTKAADALQLLHLLCGPQRISESQFRYEVSDFIVHSLLGPPAVLTVRCLDDKRVI
jgi:hypothetical protein